MTDVIILWMPWIEHEEALAEAYLKSEYIAEPYPVLRDYFREKGWEIDNIDKIVQS